MFFVTSARWFATKDVEVGFAYAFDILNIISDLGLVCLPVLIIWTLQISVAKKSTIVGCFVPRLSVVAVSIVHLKWLKIVSGGHDPTFDLWLPMLAVQVIQNLSIITACIPYLKPFLESLETGMLGSDDHRRHRLSPTYDNTNETVTGLESVSLKHSLAKIFRHSPKTPKTSTPISLQIAAGSPQQSVTVWAGDGNNEVSPWDAESQGSQAKIIRQTRTWTVE
ncbi:MAG: hypothetical protein Q9195_003536 [Heterodermia aff. obscurata]